MSYALNSASQINCLIQVKVVLLFIYSLNTVNFPGNSYSCYIILDPRIDIDVSNNPVIMATTDCAILKADDFVTVLK